MSSPRMFRAQCSSNNHFYKKGQWVYGSLQQFKGYSIFQPDLKCWFGVYGKTVGQYTGLTDKNRVQIFEDDIVKFDGELCVVRWSDEECRFELFDSYNLDHALACWRSPLIEVVGNIHNNPELLSEVKENE